MDREKLLQTLQQIRFIIDEALTQQPGHKPKTSKRSVPRTIAPVQLSFKMNLLAFMKKYSQGLSGQNKFTLLLAGLAKGSISEQVSKSELERQWNKMKVIVGGKFNAAYANRAKANGWVDTPKYGMYTLSDNWKDALRRTNG